MSNFVPIFMHIRVISVRQGVFFWTFHYEVCKFVSYANEIYTYMFLADFLWSFMLDTCI